MKTDILSAIILLCMLISCSENETLDEDQTQGTGQFIEESNTYHRKKDIDVESNINTLTLNLISKLQDRSISNLERDEIVEKLVYEKPLESSAIILTIMRENCSAYEPGFGTRPWMDDNLSSKAKIWYAACHIWQKLFEGKCTPDKVDVLLKLLDTKTDSYSLSKVLNVLRVSQWNEKAEKPVYSLATDVQINSHIKSNAFKALVSRLNDKYAIDALYFIRTLPIENQESIFSNIFSVGKNYYKWPPNIQNKVIRDGFNILEQTVNEDKSLGYFLARQLGYFLKIPGEFAPNQNNPKYKNERGLNDQFFLDTVDNALKYKKEMFR